MKLYLPERHEPLSAEPWSEARVRAGIERIASDAWSTFARDGGWPVHPLDGEGSRIGPDVYMGAAGAVWGIDRLASRGHGERLALPDGLLGRLSGEARARLPKFGFGQHPAYLLGDFGIDLVRWRVGEPGAREHVLAQAEDPERLETREVMWGASGVLLGLLFVHRVHADARTGALLEAELERTLAGWEPVADIGCDLWEQDLYGKRARLVGAVHGAVGNVHALLGAARALDDARWPEIARRGAALAKRLADVADEGANWPATWPAGGAGVPPGVLHYCHGAPGVVVCLDPIPPGFDAELDALLVAAGELVWRAGPLEKGPSLCHGTAGNGLALLKLYTRTGDARWLERARAFAMHTLGQIDAWRERLGRGRYTLWTGDLGAAVFLEQCLRGDDAFPGVDFF